MYKESRSFEERCRESATMLNRFPDRVPVIIEPRSNAPDIDKRKYMAPQDIQFAQFIYVLRRRMSLRPEQALFFFTNHNTLVVANERVADTYAKHADEDGFLYVCYSLENTFG